MEGSFPNFCKAANEVTGKLKRTTQHFTFLLASAVLRKSDVEELAKKKKVAAPRPAPVTGLTAFTGKKHGQHTELLHVNRHIFRLTFSRALTFIQHECFTEIWVFKLSPSCLDDFRFRQMLGQQKQAREKGFDLAGRASDGENEAKWLVKA